MLKHHGQGPVTASVQHEFTRALCVNFPCCYTLLFDIMFGDQALSQEVYSPAPGSS
jgi:hypothetical protein